MNNVYNVVSLNVNVLEMYFAIPGGGGLFLPPSPLSIRGSMSHTLQLRGQ